MPSTSRHDPYAALRHRTFRLYIAGSLLVVAAMAIGSPRLRRFGAMHEAAPAEDAA